MSTTLCPELPEYLSALEQCRDTAELIETVATIFAKFGVEYFSFFETPRDGATIQDLILAARFPEELYRLYRERQMFRVDPAMRFARKATSPFRGVDAPRHPDEEWYADEWLAKIKEFGIFNELYIPVVVPDGVWGNVWVSGKNFDPL